MTPADLANAFVAAWNDHDADAVAALFLPDGRMTTAFGQLLRGREAVRDGHARAFEGPYAGARIAEHAVETLRERPQLALVAIDWRIEGAEGAPANRGSLLLVLERRQGGWLIVAGQNTPRAVRTA